MTAEQQDQLIKILFKIEQMLSDIHPSVSSDLFQMIDRLGDRFIMDGEG